MLVSGAVQTRRSNGLDSIVEEKEKKVGWVLLWPKVRVASAVSG